jgi:hypothetical protein
MPQDEKYKLLVSKLQSEIISSSDFSLFHFVPNDASVTYLDVYMLYRKLFVEFIARQLNIHEYDSNLQQKNLNLRSIDETNMDFYQLFSSNLFKYFYIRNDVYIERLNEEELTFFVQKIKRKDFTLDDATIHMISSTIPKVIFEYPHVDGKTYMSFYGPNTNPYMALTESIVIGFRYDTYNRDGMTNEEWIHVHNKQDLYLYEYLKDMKRELNTKCNFPVQVIQYNEFSIGHVKI